MRLEESLALLTFTRADRSPSLLSPTPWSTSCSVVVNEDGEGEGRNEEFAHRRCRVWKKRARRAIQFQLSIFKTPSCQTWVDHGHLVKNILTTTGSMSSCVVRSWRSA
jgi:hypothetical protein